MDKSFR